MIKNIVFGCGSIKGLIYIGCLQYMEEHNLLSNITTIVGTSVGGIFALLLNLGYTSIELKKLALHIDFSKLSNVNSESILQVMETFGIDSGEKLLNLLSILIKKKVKTEKITFQQLYEITKQKIIITGTCLTTNEVEYFSYETHPTMEILKAIQITFTIPFVYNKVIYNDKYYLDGAIVNDFPIQLFHESKKIQLDF